MALLKTLANSELAAIRLAPQQYSTDRALWVNPDSQDATIELLEVFPDQDGDFRVVFPDTVVVEVETPVAVLKKNGKVVGSPQPQFAKDLSPLIHSLFGVKGEYHGCTLGSGNMGVQAYRISTCNIPLPKVFQVCKDIIDGKYLYLDKPIRFVRLDVTTNVPAAVEPTEEASPDAPLGWEYKDNRHYVGDCCHTYIVEQGVETKIYDKFRYMLEVGALASYVGDNLANILDSNQDNIKKAFYSRQFQDQGFGRIETRFIGSLPATAEELVSKHLGYVDTLVGLHCAPTSFQDSWDSFLQPGHRQTAVLVRNADTNEVTWTFARWVNKLTDKANGFSGVGEDTFWVAIKHRSIGEFAVDVYELKVKNEEVTLDSTTHILPDRYHKANLIHIREGGTSQASVVTSGLSWGKVRLLLPFSMSDKCGKGRTIKTRGEADTSVIEAGEFSSVASVEKKVKKVAAQQEKRAKQALEKLLAAVEKDALEVAPSDWKKHQHISALAAVAKPVCTRYYFDSGLKYPTYMVKVGKKWYKGNSKLNRLLEANPKLPFTIQVWDTNKVYQASKVWGVAIQPID